MEEPQDLLDGLTPRQAARQPAWRRRLGALLDDLEWNARRTRPEILDLLDQLRTDVAEIGRTESEQAPLPETPQAHTVVLAETRAGAKRLAVPFQLTSLEREVLTWLLRFNLLTEADLAAKTGSRRIAGVMSHLMERFCDHGLASVLTDRGQGQFGRVYFLTGGEPVEPE
jgi:hypothetical protein